MLNVKVQEGASPKDIAKLHLDTGFVFVADEGQPAVWRLSSDGELITETILTSAGVGSGQLAKVTWHRYCIFIVCEEDL